MGVLLPDVGNRSSSSGKAGSDCIHVGHCSYSNTAAKFWTVLFDEVLDAFPEADEIVVSGKCGGLLHPTLLNPEAALNAGMAELDRRNMRDVFNEITAALDIVGPPIPLHVRLEAQGQPVLDGDMPLDAVDSDLIPFLFVWMLEWASMAEFAWNREHISGVFDADDRARMVRYRVSFSLHNRHISEGLYYREMRVRAHRVSSHAEAGDLT